MGQVMPNTVLNSFIPNHSVIDIFPGLAAFPGSGAGDCSSCEALWRDYRDAMIAHLAAVDALDLARFMNSPRKAQYLEGDVARAERKRDQARLAALSHEKSHRDRLAA